MRAQERIDYRDMSGYNSHRQSTCYMRNVIGIHTKIEIASFTVQTGSLVYFSNQGINTVRGVNVQKSCVNEDNNDKLPQELMDTFFWWAMIDCTMMLMVSVQQPCPNNRRRGEDTHMSISLHRSEGRRK